MRQTGRYHDHYQKIRTTHGFMECCKNPELACEITMGPIEEFDFDAAIMFSDLLFPLEQLNMGLSYENGPPSLQIKLDSWDVLKKLIPQTPAKDFYNFQRETLRLITKRLSPHKTLLGFVGAPFTLYAYAVEGAHKGNLTEAKKGLYDGRFSGFMEVLLPQLQENLNVQADSPADAFCLFDTAAGELSLDDYKTFILPIMRNLAGEFKKNHPHKKLIYYSKHTHLDYLSEIKSPHIDVLGIDWRVNLPDALEKLGKDYYIQGGIDPSHLFLPKEHLENKLATLWKSLQKPDIPLDRWICGLGHGVLPKTPQENVKERFYSV